MHRPDALANRDVGVLHAALGRAFLTRRLHTATATIVERLSCD